MEIMGPKSYVDENNSCDYKQILLVFSTVKTSTSC